MTSEERTGMVLAGSAATMVGGSVAASSILTGYPVLGGQAVRYAAASAVLALWARWRQRRLPRVERAEFLWLNLLAAVGLAGCSVAQIEATRLSNPAVVGVVIGAAPIVIAALAPAIMRTRPSLRVLIAAATVVAGTGLAQIGSSGGDGSSPAGLIATIAALSGVAATSLLAGPILPRLGVAAVSVYACGIAAVQLLLIAVAVHLIQGAPILTIPTPTQTAALAYLTLIVTGVVFLTWYSAVERLGVERTGLFNGVIPIATLAAVRLVGAGTVTALQGAGAGTVIAGILLGLHQHDRR